MPQILLTGQLKEKPTYRVLCLYSSFVHGIGYQNAAETSKVVYRDSVRPALENFSTNAQQASGMTTFRNLFLSRFSPSEDLNTVA